MSFWESLGIAVVGSVAGAGITVFGGYWLIRPQLQLDHLISAYADLSQSISHIDKKLSEIDHFIAFDGEGQYPKLPRLDEDIDAVKRNAEVLRMLGEKRLHRCIIARCQVMDVINNSMVSMIMEHAFAPDSPAIFATSHRKRLGTASKSLRLHMNSRSEERILEKRRLRIMERLKKLHMKIRG